MLIGYVEDNHAHWKMGLLTRHYQSQTLTFTTRLQLFHLSIKPYTIPWKAVEQRPHLVVTVLRYSVVLGLSIKTCSVTILWKATEHYFHVMLIFLVKQNDVICL